MARCTTPLAFTDGDTFKRFTITNAAVSAQSDIGVSIRKHEVTETDDVGWVYLANVVSIQNGSFSVNVAAFSNTSDPSAGEFPNETVSLVYHT